MEALLFLCLSLVISIPITIWQGFVLTKLWAWFIVPVFGLPALGLVPAIGLAAVITYLTTSVPHDIKDKGYSDLVGHQVSVGLILPAFALLTGWFWHLFM